MDAPSRADTRRLTAIQDQIDSAIGKNISRSQPSSSIQYGEPQRDAVNAVIDQIRRDLEEKIGALHRQLDDIDQRLSDSAATAKGSLQDHIAVCIKINQEVTHMADVIAEIGESVPKS
jgi:hypothetical protein